MKILIMNGPNLNLLGQREPSIYGTGTMETYVAELRKLYPEVELEYFQSNIEGLMIDRLQATLRDGTNGVVLNAGAYTHTSIALGDCIRSLACPVVEVHISNVYQREEYRHRSMISATCKGIIAGFGLHSYRLGIEALLKD
ncbi:type II 3-dehydroquinate dehydratase [Alloprevotella rava]|uniref:3-dehydroquinate dehydratase n=1 Tax=Alloprevotella rava TaxID=671218 RepID=A0A7W5UDU6_9BACT|nr:type II 3-dehydroquinate dehydratase [Alloprevotella rava]MBB3702243.1 3-dehydroquinate dehydratase-2 [Alloprevotella rava]